MMPRPLLAKLGSLLFLSVPVVSHTPKLWRTLENKADFEKNKTKPVLEPATGFFRTPSGAVQYFVTNSNMQLFNSECGVGALFEPNTIISVSDIVILFGRFLAKPKHNSNFVVLHHYIVLIADDVGRIYQILLRFI
jgi:hypothetical protein